MKLSTPGSVKTIKKYMISGNVAPEKIDVICEELLYNKLVQHRIRTSEAGDIEFLHSIPEYNFKLIKVDLLSADDQELLKISKDAHLFLNLDEMKAIKVYFDIAEDVLKLTDNTSILVYCPLQLNGSRTLDQQLQILMQQGFY